MGRWRPATRSYFVECRHVGKIVALFWTKCVVPRQVKTKILELSNREGQNNLSFVTTLVSRKKKDYYHVVSVGQLGFDRRSYYGRRHRMQSLHLSYMALIDRPTARY